MSGSAIWKQESERVKTEEGYLMTEDGLRLYYKRAGCGPATLIPNGLYLFDDFNQLADRRTLIFYDVRNRGLSDGVADRRKLELGILNDVHDLDAVRRHFDLCEIDLVGHSYMGLMIVLYALNYGRYVRRLIQIGAMQPVARTQYPSHLTGNDSTVADVLARLAQLQQNPGSVDPEQRCVNFWSVLRELYVVEPSDVGRIKWGRCDLPNERNFRKYWSEMILPSIQKLTFTPEELARVTHPVLTIHGERDRSSPYGGGRDWATRLPNARLVSIRNAAHAPWIESPGVVFGAIESFLAGAWPDNSCTVLSLDQ